MDEMELRHRCHKSRELKMNLEHPFLGGFLLGMIVGMSIMLVLTAGH